MRLDKFESGNMDSIGEGNQKEIFINPENEKKIISEMKESAEKDTTRQLKGRYYLTKIIHELLPNNIPDVYQAGESIDGKQTIDAERISHTPGHIRLQEERRSGEDEEKARKQIIEEMGKEIGELDLELERIGLGFNIDENVGNYTKDESGNVHYLETFKPWQVDPVNPKELEVLFEEEELRKAIDDISNQRVKEECMQHLERLLVLLEEDKQELRESQEVSLMECGPHIEELEIMLAPFMEEEALATLNAIQTKEEARNSEKRTFANKALVPIFKKLDFLVNETNITDERYHELYKKYRILYNATGAINRGMVDHDR